MGKRERQASSFKLQAASCKLQEKAAVYANCFFLAACSFQLEAFGARGKESGKLQASSCKKKRRCTRIAFFLLLVAFSLRLSMPGEKRAASFKLQAARKSGGVRELLFSCCL
ncbi:hypothetical protein [Pseudomonas juntendi]